MQRDGGREERWRGEDEGGMGGARVPGERPDHQAVVAATRTMESSYENEVGVIDWVGKVFIPAY